MLELKIRFNLLRICSIQLERLCMKFIKKQDLGRLLILVVSQKLSKNILITVFQIQISKLFSNI